MAVTDERVSRRKLLKRAGAGAAVLGAGSMISAAAAGAVNYGCHDCECDPCFNAPHCAPDSYCIPTTEGCCFCHQASFCKCLASCSSSDDCPPGWACAWSCCGSLYEFGFLCHPPHGSSAVCETAGGPMSNSKALPSDVGGGQGGNHDEHGHG